MLPKKIGRYEIQAEIGCGGFGRVYRARDPVVGRDTAIKVFSGSDDPSQEVRFRNEANAAGSLRHPSIVTIYEFGSDGPNLFIAMEYLEGDDLQKLISSRRPMSLLDKVNILSQVADGLVCAQQHGVIHRDIKPSNLMILSDGTVKILDFGIARMDQKSHTITQPGFLIGTVMYMAPEHLMGERADALSDIFAYGLTAYELLTGQHPYSEDKSVPLLQQASDAKVRPLREKYPEIPQTLAAVVHRCLERDRALRYQTFADLQLDLQQVLFDLREEQANTLLTAVRQMVAAGKFEQAQEGLRGVLMLDPANTQARELRDQVQQQIARTAVRVKVESFLKASGEEIGKHDVQAALQLLESAARLDPARQTVQTKLAAVREQLAKPERARKLVEQAENALKDGQLTAARRLAEEAVASDPSAPRVAELLKTVQEAIIFREQQRRLQDVLARSRALLASDECDRAIQVLTELDASGRAAPEVGQLFNEAKSRKQVLERARELEQGKRKISQLIVGSQFQDAYQIIRKLEADFPAEPELAEMSEFLQLRLNEEQRSARAKADATVLMPVKQAPPVLRSVPKTPPPARPPDSPVPPNVVQPAVTPQPAVPTPHSAAAISLFQTSKAPWLARNKPMLILGGALVIVGAASISFLLTHESAPLPPQVISQKTRWSQPATAPSPGIPASSPPKAKAATPVETKPTYPTTPPPPPRPTPATKSERTSATTTAKPAPPIASAPAPTLQQAQNDEPPKVQPPNLQSPGQPPEAVPRPNPSPPAAPEDYRGPPKLSFIWQGRLEPGATLVIQGASTSTGAIFGASRVPKVRGSVSSAQKVAVLEQPSEGNGFRIVLRNDDSSPLETLRFAWRRAESVE